MTEYYKMHQGIPAVNGVDVKLTSIPADVSALIEAVKQARCPTPFIPRLPWPATVQAMLARRQNSQGRACQAMTQTGIPMRRKREILTGDIDLRR